MKKFKRLTALICLMAVKSWATTYYVTPSGSNSNNGLAATTGGGNGPWATLTYAAQNSVLAAGDIIYVKAGNYGSENVVFTKSGSSGSPISFIGYTSTPGDTPPVLVTSATVSTTFSTSDMPTYTGWSRSSAGTAFDLSAQKYITLKNFQIKTYQIGVLAGGTAAQNADYITLENVNVMTIGSTSVNYSGKAIQFGSMGTAFSDHSTIKNCLVINSTYSGIDINGDYNTVSGSKVFCNENITSLASTDYYTSVCGSYNTFTSCYAERASGITATGNGFGAWSNAEQVVDQGLPLGAVAAQYNTFSYCTTKNIAESFYVYFRTAQYNTFYHCDAVGTHTGTSGSSGEGGGIVIRDGASDNLFDGCKIADCSNGITFYDTSADGDTGGSPTGHPGSNNKIYNCQINNCYVGVNYSDNGIQSDAGDNTIGNCTFYKSRYLHYAGRHCAYIKNIGNIYYGTSQNPYGGYFKGSTYASDIVVSGANTYYKQCDLIYIEGGNPSGFTGGSTTNISSDPSFVSSTNLHLTNTSPCIDKVDQISLSANPKDYDNKPRYFGVKSDMGAYEGYSYTGKVYYVTTSGSNSNNGLAETTGGGNGPWATLTYAASSTPNLQPGDVVYVKAGSYGNENVVFANSGSSGNPISYIGYTSTPGDAPPVLVTSATGSTTFTTSDMPTYTGSSRSSGIAFDARVRNYLSFKNFQIRTYEYAFLGGGTKVQNAGNLTLENVNAMTLGNTSSSYSGKGLQVGDMGTKFSNKNSLTNCLVINAAAEAFDINGNSNTLTGCKAFCSENTGNAATDYYMLICGTKNIVTSCYVERQAGISHGGHGIGAKTNAEQVIDQGLALDTVPSDSNQFINCSAKNMGESFFVRHRGAKYNLFYHCSAVGTHTGTSAASGEGGGITIRDGASYNTFDGCTATDCSEGITFEDTSEDGDTGGSPTGHPGNYNKILNAIITNCYIGVCYSSYSIQSDAGSNTIANCTFYKSRYLHYAGRHCANMTYIGNIYYGTSNNPYGGYWKGNTYSSDVVAAQFTESDIIYIEGGASGFTGGSTTNIASDPLFVSSTDLHLTSSSPCIDKVDNIILADNPYDFDNKARYNGVKSDMGAYEYYSPRPEETTSISKEDANGVISLYPNPSNGLIYINSSLDASYQIAVFNVMGQCVYNKSYSSAVNLSDLNSGIYFFRILSANGVVVADKKISIQQ